jgi:6-phosphogluconolactonase
MPEPEFHVFPSLQPLNEAAARRTVELIARTPEPEPFAIALSGGSTPRPFYELLGSRFANQIPWERVHLFWGDERCVPMDHPESNFRLAQETLIGHVPIPEENVHRIRTELKDTDEIIARYDYEIRAFLQAGGKHGLDLAVMGMGDDGHTASIFPGTPILREQLQWVAVAEAPSAAPVRQRITMTLPLLSRSRHVMFLVAGATKVGALSQIRDMDFSACRDIPAACVEADETLEWFVDKAAYGE